MERSVTLREQIGTGLVAGVAGGILWYLFFFVVIMRSGAGWRGVQASFLFIASVLVGNHVDPAVGVPLGIVLHFCVAVGWALGYVYLVRTQPYLLTRPWISGIGFGLVVYVFMQIVLITAGVWHRPASPRDLEEALIAHVVFYGIPVALVASRLLRPRSTSAPA